MCLWDIISPQNSVTGTVYSPNPEFELNLRGVSFFSFILPSVLFLHAKRSHGPLRDTPDGSCSRVSRFPHLIRLGTRQLQFMTNQQTKTVVMNLESNSSLNGEEKSFRHVPMVANFLGDNNRKHHLKNE